MKIETIKFQHRGKTYTGSVATPESLEEAVASLGASFVYQRFAEGYREWQKKALRRKPKKHLRIELEKLSPEKRQQLEALLDRKID